MLNSLAIMGAKAPANKGARMRILLIALFSLSTFGAENIYTVVANSEITKLTAELDKAEKAGQKLRVQAILAKLQFQSRILASAKN